MLQLPERELEEWVTWIHLDASFSWTLRLQGMIGLMEYSTGAANRGFKRTSAQWKSCLKVSTGLELSFSCGRQAVWR